MYVTDRDAWAGTNNYILFINDYRLFTEILDGFFYIGGRTEGEKSRALHRPAGATWSLAATNVAGLPGCAYLQSLGTENEERWRRPRFVRVGAEGNEVEWFSRTPSNT